MAGEQHGEASGNSNGNGYVRWHQLHPELQTLEQRVQSQLQRHEDQVTVRMRQAHDYHNGLHRDWTDRVEGTERRVDKVEAVIDQQRGARALIYALIGTNLLAAILAGVAIVAAIS